MKKYSVLVISILLLSSISLAQVAINISGNNPDASAMLDVVSTTKGILIPRMTETQIMYIDNPANGLTVFNTEQSCFYFYNALAGEWKEMAIATGTITPWTCGDALIDSRDSKSYTTVEIGTQCWMAENLNIGTSINSVYNQTNNNIIEKHCYDNNDANCTTYGGLYQWNEMMQYVTSESIQGICPEGWYLPTHTEWSTLTDYLGGGSIAGGKLKEEGTAHWNSPNTGATNESGFTAFGGGYRYNSAFNSLGHSGFWWTSSEYSGTTAWRRLIYYNSDDALMNDVYKSHTYSVRCLKN